LFMFFCSCLLVHVLPGKLLELVRMEQAPLRVFPRAHFPRRELCALCGVAFDLHRSPRERS
jgi:hypothetical protein